MSEPKYTGWVVCHSKIPSMFYSVCRCCCFSLAKEFKPAPVRQIGLCMKLLAWKLFLMSPSARLARQRAEHDVQNRTVCRRVRWTGRYTELFAEWDGEQKGVQNRTMGGWDDAQNRRVCTAGRCGRGADSDDLQNRTMCRTGRFADRGDAKSRTMCRAGRCAEQDDVQRDVQNRTVSRMFKVNNGWLRGRCGSQPAALLPLAEL